jgi:hypothetical protein
LQRTKESAIIATTAQRCGTPAIVSGGPPLGAGAAALASSASEPEAASELEAPSPSSYELPAASKALSASWRESAV